jgi:lipopolysaccharide biosynthesis glycosyltransferase
MGKNVLVALADRNYLDPAKQLFSTAYWNSGWKGDYLLLAYNIPESELVWFIEKGIKIKHSEPLDCGSEKFGDEIMACKCNVFTEYFKQWDNVVYLDVDIVSRGSLQNMNSTNKFGACYSLGQTLKDNFIDETLIPKDLWKEATSKYNLESKAFNAGVMAFPTSIIYKDMFADIMTVFKKYVKFALFGGDQLPLNLYFYKRWEELSPVYNQIATLGDTNFQKELLSGLVIHCVRFGNGPWKEDCVVYDEWKLNFDKSDMIDLQNIPDVPPFSDKEIEKRSRKIVELYLVGGKMNFKNFLKLFNKGFKLAVKNPGKTIWKVKSLLK